MVSTALYARPPTAATIQASQIWETVMCSKMLYFLCFILIVCFLFVCSLIVGFVCVWGGGRGGGFVCLFFVFSAFIGTWFDDPFFHLLIGKIGKYLFV